MVVVIGAWFLEWGWGVEQMVCVCGDRYPGASSSRDVSVELRCAGLRQTFSVLLLILINYLLVCLVMGYGPSWNGCKGLQTASWPTKTCVAVDRLWCMLTIFMVGVGGVGLTCRKCYYSALINSEGSGRELVEDEVKNSPGKWRVVAWWAGISATYQVPVSWNGRNLPTPQCSKDEVE